MKPETIIVIGLILNTMVMLFTISFVLFYHAPAENYWYNVTRTIGGVYIPNCGFFVDTRGASSAEIENTMNHEALHAIIRQGNKTHFCGE